MYKTVALNSLLTCQMHLNPLIKQRKKFGILQYLPSAVTCCSWFQLRLVQCHLLLKYPLRALLGRNWWLFFL